MTAEGGTLTLIDGERYSQRRGVCREQQNHCSSLDDVLYQIVYLFYQI